MAVFAPHIMSQRIGYLNSNEASIRWKKRLGTAAAGLSFADPDVSDAMHRDENRHMGVDWTYGGYLENRPDLWCDIAYLKAAGTFVHPAIDLWVPAGTEVFAVLDGPVLYTGNDTPLKGGWGKHVIQKVIWNDQVFALIYGHLHKTLECKKGDDLKKGQSIGHVGDKYNNGWWGPHLHLQLWGTDVDGVTDWKKFLDEHDGYVKLEERDKWAKICPDPTPLIFERVYEHSLLQPK